MDRAQKKEAVTELNEKLQNSGSVVVCHYKGLTVSEITELRSKLREQGANFKVTKNSLARRAAEGTDYAGLVDLFTGPTGIAFSEDQVPAAKVTYEFAKDNDKLVILGGAMGATMLDVAGVEQLAKLPSLDELRSKLVGLLQAPASKLVGVMEAPAGQVARVVGAYGNSEN